MVFVNGQKFACATCIKGHRSTSCNHGERPLHEIKKKGRPSTQCMHCKELRKAKQVHVRCICGREEGSPISSGLKRTKSLSHEGHTDAEGLCSKDTNIHSCGCLEGGICTCCRDREGHVVVKPGSTSSRQNLFRSYSSTHQRGAASLDLGKPGMVLHPRELSSILSFPPHAQGGPSTQSPDGSASPASSLSINGTFTGLRLSNSGVPSPLVQAVSSGSPGSDYSPITSSPMNNQHSQMPSNLCFDYTSSSDYDSDQYNSPVPYAYFQNNMVNYAMSDTSDDFGDRDAILTQESNNSNNNNRPTPMNTAASDGVTTLYSTLPGFPSAVSTSSSPMPIQPFMAFSGNVPSSTPPSVTEKSCCKPTSSNPSPTLPISRPSASGSSFAQERAETDGCGCAISASMCCCGELCACPGCLAYPNNPNQLSSGLASTAIPAPFPSCESGGVTQNIAPLSGNTSAAQPSTTPSVLPKGSCCGSTKPSAVLSNDPSNSANSHSLNLSRALSIIGAKGQNGSANMPEDVRQALRQGFSALDQTSLESAKMQHPTLLGDNGVLICGCGCGRPTVDCADCFRDMCEFVGESQAKLLKDELEFDMAMNQEGGYLADLGLNLNMSMAMNMSLSMSMEMNMDMNPNEGNAEPSEFGLGQGLEPSQDADPSFMLEQPQVAHSQQTEVSQQYFQAAEPPSGASQDDVSNKDPTQTLSQNHALHKQPQTQEQLLHEQEQRLRLQLLEQEQMQLSQLQPSNLNHLQLDFLDDEDWSFVDEIREEGHGQSMSGIQRS
ncbi:hypothetical protein BGZ72_006410 [Mortierella alpina]|nr:hypothetical protein BGZ72_006410 [Mortierella alpina]